MNKNFNSSKMKFKYYDYNWNERFEKLYCQSRDYLCQDKTRVIPALYRHAPRWYIISCQEIERMTNREKIDAVYFMFNNKHCFLKTKYDRLFYDFLYRIGESI